eukprot:365506-Chlamydomonas_euryale.AAC.11
MLLPSQGLPAVAGRACGDAGKDSPPSPAAAAHGEQVLARRGRCPKAAHSVCGLPCGACTALAAAAASKAVAAATAAAVAAACCRCRAAVHPPSTKALTAPKTAARENSGSSLPASPTQASPLMAALLLASAAASSAAASTARASSSIRASGSRTAAATSASSRDRSPHSSTRSARSAGSNGSTSSASAAAPPLFPPSRQPDRSSARSVRDSPARGDPSADTMRTLPKPSAPTHASDTPRAPCSRPSASASASASAAPGPRAAPDPARDTHRGPVTGDPPSAFAAYARIASASAPQLPTRGLPCLTPPPLPPPPASSSCAGAAEPAPHSADTSAAAPIGSDARRVPDNPSATMPVRRPALSVPSPPPFPLSPRPAHRSSRDSAAAVAGPSAFPDKSRWLSPQPPSHSAASSAAPDASPSPHRASRTRRNDPQPPKALPPPPPKALPPPPPQPPPPPPPRAAATAIIAPSVAASDGSAHSAALPDRSSSWRPCSDAAHDSSDDAALASSLPARAHSAPTSARAVLPLPPPQLPSPSLCCCSCSSESSAAIAAAPPRSSRPLTASGDASSRRHTATPSPPPAPPPPPGPCAAAFAAAAVAAAAAAPVGAAAASIDRTRCCIGGDAACSHRGIVAARGQPDSAARSAVAADSGSAAAVATRCPGTPRSARSSGTLRERAAGPKGRCAQSVSRSVGRSDGQPVSQSVNQSVGRSVRLMQSYRTPAGVQQLDDPAGGERERERVQQW